MKLQLICTLMLALCLQATSYAQETLLNLAQMTKYLNGVVTTEDLSQRTDIKAIGIADAQNAYYFTSEQAFDTWATALPGGAALIQRNTALNQIYQFAQSHGYLDLEEGATLPVDLQQYIQTVLPGAFSQGQSTSVLFANFYDLPEYKGASKFCTGNFWPNLGNFRNRAESFGGAGTGIISFCDHKWFGGKKLHILLAGALKLPDFQDMNNRIESYFNL